MSAERTRTVTWADPLDALERMRGLSGVDALRAKAKLSQNRTPTDRDRVATAMNIWLAEVEEGRVVFEGDPGEFHYNPIGSVHGGFAATLFDSAMGCAVHSKLPAGVGYATLDLHVRYTRPISHKTGLVRCEARAVHVGKTIATAEADLTDARGRLLGHGTSSCAIFR